MKNVTPPIVLLVKLEGIEYSYLFFLEFTDSTVVYNIKSPTVDLNSVYFPSVVVCNLNILRRSFIMSLLNETKLGQNVDFVQLHSLIDNGFLSGGNIELSNEEQDIINSKPMYDT